MLNLAILGLLRERPMHGYELHQRLITMGFWRISFGSVYPAMARLEKFGFIEAIAGPGRRKTFRLTAAGESELEVMLAGEDTPAANSSAFRVRVSFLRYLPPAARVLVLQRRKEVLEERVTMIEAAVRNMAMEKAVMDRYTISEMTHRAGASRYDIAWLEQLILEEQKLSGPTTASTV